MIVQRGDVKLIRLGKEDIELVRTWRNAPEIQARMEYREYITAEMQAAWFNKIDNVNNFYFLVSIQDKYIGLINAADIDWDENIAGNCGILESAKTTEASLLFTDTGFCSGLGHLYAKILKDNTPSIYYNQTMGYRLLPGQEQVINQVYELTSHVYFNATAKLRSYSKLERQIKFLFTKEEAIQFAFLIKRFAMQFDTYGISVSVETEL